MHQILSKIRDNNHVVNILLVGAGGTGSQLLQSLARINAALNQLRKAGIMVHVMDDDIITRSNLGRQLFCESDIGELKAEILINRINRFFSINWKSIPIRLTENNNLGNYDVIITCCDNVITRKIISEQINQLKAKQYWIDCGNTKTTGQIWFSAKYDNVNDIFDEFGDIQEDIDTPSCSLAEALDKQDLFINTIIADMAGHFVWKLFRNVVLYTQAIFINLHPDLGPTIKSKKLVCQKTKKIRKKKT